MFAALKPGAIFGVVDHHARVGDGDRVGKSLHRVEASLVRKEIEAAGFVLEKESEILRNKKDKRDWNIFSRSGFGRDATDRFVYRFRKPRATSRKAKTPEKDGEAKRERGRPDAKKRSER